MKHIPRFTPVRSDCISVSHFFGQTIFIPTSQRTCFSRKTPQTFYTRCNWKTQTTKAYQIVTRFSPTVWLLFLIKQLCSLKRPTSTIYVYSSSDAKILKYSDIFKLLYIAKHNLPRLLPMLLQAGNIPWCSLFTFWSALVPKNDIYIMFNVTYASIII